MVDIAKLVFKYKDNLPDEDFSKFSKRLKTYDLMKLGNIRKVPKVHRMIA